MANKMQQILADVQEDKLPDFNDPEIIESLFGGASTQGGVLYDGGAQAMAQKERALYRRLLARASKEAKERGVSLSEFLAADTKGGPGSGFFGHAGRPGKIGGSAPGKGKHGRAVVRAAPRVARDARRAAGRTARQAVNSAPPPIRDRIKKVGRLLGFGRRVETNTNPAASLEDTERVQISDVAAGAPNHMEVFYEHVDPKGNKNPFGRDQVSRFMNDSGVNEYFDQVAVLAGRHPGLWNRTAMRITHGGLVVPPQMNVAGAMGPGTRSSMALFSGSPYLQTKDGQANWQELVNATALGTAQAIGVHAFGYNAGNAHRFSPPPSFGVASVGARRAAGRDHSTAYVQTVAKMITGRDDLLRPQRTTGLLKRRHPRTQWIMDNQPEVARWVIEHRPAFHRGYYNKSLIAPSEAFAQWANKAADDDNGDEYDDRQALINDLEDGVLGEHEVVSYAYFDGELEMLPDPAGATWVVVVYEAEDEPVVEVFSLA